MAVVLLKQRKKDIKIVLLASLFILIFVISSIPTSNNLQPIKNEDINDPPNNKENENSPFSSDLNLTDYITGLGVDQDVRLFMANKSESNLNNEEYFEITSPDSNMFLSYGDLNFTFQSNFTTEYIVEGDDALYPYVGYNHPGKFRFNATEEYSGLTINDGSDNDPDYGYNELVDDIEESCWNLTSTAAGLLNFTICANFSVVPPTDHGILGKTYFDREKILGLMLNFTYNLNKDGNLTIYMKDNGTWKNVTNTIDIKSDSGVKNETDEVIINENLKYINATDCCPVNFVFRSNEKFNATLYSFDLHSLMVFELPITNESYVALEFDLRDESSTINGFYAWIRTLNLTEAVNTELNITLYQANTTIERDATYINLRANSLKPNLSQPIDTIILNSYENDELHYFKFDISNTANLSLYNYFIVVKSNRSDIVVYSLVTLPFIDFGDNNEVDHQLKTTADNGKTWVNAEATIDEVNSEQLDASLFKLNVTRGFMPSDFNCTLKIQGEEIRDFTDAEAHQPNEPELKWGKGRWTNDFTNYIAATLNKFNVSLTWDKNIIKIFTFNVKFYIEAFRLENATSSYRAAYDGIPEWTLNYTLNLTRFIYYNWNFTEFWYIFPNYYTAHNLTAPDGTQILSQTTGVLPVSDKEGYNKTIVSTTIINVTQPDKYNGTYSLNLTCQNAIRAGNTHSYIKYNEILWETQGFMYRDNISVSVDIQDHNNLAPKNGPGVCANISLFFPNKTKFPDKRLNSTKGVPSDDNTVLSYDFDNQTILDLTNDIPILGEYYLGYFWTNGSIIGCRKMIIYIDAYKIELNDFEYYPTLKERGEPPNILLGTIKNKVFASYTLLVASVNETTKNVEPNFYPINQSITEQQGTFSYELNGNNLEVYLNRFMQNESILNPDETVNFRTTIQNNHPFIELNVNISVKLVSLANEEWIIAESTSQRKTLKPEGDPGLEDTQEFSVNLTIPTLGSDGIWKGVNAPVRKGGAKTIVTVYIEGNNVGTYSSSEYSLLINQTDDQFEGYIIALKNDLTTSKYINLGFERDECIYQPNKTVLIVNIYDENYVSIYNQVNFSESLELDSEFANIEINPENPINGKIFEISSVLSTEFGENLPDKEVSCYYEYDGSWEKITSRTTDINGSTTFEIDTQDIEVDDVLAFKLTWSGDSRILSTDETFDIPIEIDDNDITITFKEELNVIYRNTKAVLKVKLENTGTSNLEITDIIVEIEGDLDYEIEGENKIISEKLVPGEETDITIVIDVGNTKSNTIDITVIIESENIISNEEVSDDESFTVDVIDKPIFYYIIEYFSIIILALLALAFVMAVFYAKKVKKKIEIPLKEPVKRRPRKGRYVKVTEIEPEKVEAKKVEPKVVEPKVVAPKKVEPKKVEPKKIAPKKVEPKKITPKKVEPEITELEKPELKKVKPKKVKPKKVKPKKIKAKKAKLKEIEKAKTTDLDTLIEQERLKQELKKAKKPSKKKTKPPKEVKKPVKKVKKPTPQRISTRKMVEQKKRKQRKVVRQLKKRR